MGIISSYDIVSWVIEDASSDFGSGWEIDDDVLSAIKEDCAKMDKLVSDLDLDSTEAKVDEAKRSLIVSMKGCDMTFQDGRKSPFFDIIQHASEFSFTNDGNDMVVVSVVYDGLWKEAD